MRKLKTFTAESGFYELAVAAPSMKAALMAWGMTHNAFHQGYARQVIDAEIVAAAEADPGEVLRRPIGTKGAFKKDPDPIKTPTPPVGKKTTPRVKSPDPRKVRTAERALAKGAAAHSDRTATLKVQLRKLQDRINAEESRWQSQSERLQAALNRLEKRI